jgi:hypothetical protein
MYIPNESFRSALVSECSISDSKKDCDTSDSTAELWVSASGKVTQRPSSWRGWKTRPWSQRLFQTISMISMNGGEDALIGLWLDSHANRGPSQAHRKAQATNDGSGTTSCESSMSPKPHSSSLKTSLDSPLAKLNGESWWTDQKSLFGGTDLIPFYDRWPKEGSMLNGAIFKRSKLVLVTDESAFLSWPTSQAGDFRGGMGNQEMLSDVVRDWPTPNTLDSLPPRDPEKLKAWNNSRDGRKNRVALSNLRESVDAEDWRTPDSHLFDAKSTVKKFSGRTPSDPQVGLADEVADWATPAAQQSNGTPENFLRRKREAVARGSKMGICLSDLQVQVMDWGTPTSRDHKDGACDETVDVPTNKLLGREVTRFSPPAETENSGTESSKPIRTSRPRLNPAFDCWLMGFPPLWTHPEPISCDALGMVAYRSALRSRLHGLLSGLGFSEPATQPELFAPEGSGD